MVRFSLSTALKALLIGAVLPLNVHAATVKRMLVVSKGNAAPDGVTREVFLINGATPGPLIEATEGDDLEITVMNVSGDPITIHWHGVEQWGTPWSDGVPGVTQYPIKTGKTFIYRFKATQYGFFFWHSHSRHQLSDGLRGTLYIKPKSSRAKPFSLISNSSTEIAAMNAADAKPFYLDAFDWTHKDAKYYDDEWARTGVEQLCTDSILINGKGQVICPIEAITTPIIPPPVGSITKKACGFPNNTLLYPFLGQPDQVDPDIWYNCKNTTTPLQVYQVNAANKYAVFHVVNSGSVWDLRISIDGHKLYTFAADSSYIKPVESEAIEVPIGERFSFLIKLDQPKADYTIRVGAAVVPQLISGFAVLSYTNTTSRRDRAPSRVMGRQVTAAGPIVTTTPVAKNPSIDWGANLIGNARSLHGYDTKPFVTTPPPQGPANFTYFLDLNRPKDREWVLNSMPFPENGESLPPLLWNPTGVQSMDPKLSFSHPNGSIVDVIMTVTSGNPSLHPPHPVHKHGIKAWHLGHGTGAFPFQTIAEAVQANSPLINIVDPAYKDTFVTPPGAGGQGWAAFRYRVLDPFATVIHCHISPHIDTGMTVVMLEGFEKMAPIPPYYTSQGP